MQGLGVPPPLGVGARGWGRVRSLSPSQGRQASGQASAVGGGGWEPSGAWGSQAPPCQVQSGRGLVGGEWKKETEITAFLGCHEGGHVLKAFRLVQGDHL